MPLLGIATGKRLLHVVDHVAPCVIVLQIPGAGPRVRQTVVQVPGGGGIGATLLTAFDRYEFDSAAAILLVIIGIVMCVEYSSGIIRNYIK